MEKYIEDALNSVEFLANSAIEDCSDVAEQHMVDKDWVLEKFRDKIVVKINKIIKGN